MNDKVKQIFNQLEELADKVENAYSDDESTMTGIYLDRLAGDIRGLVSEYSLLLKID